MRKILNILIACEESQAICKEFRALGHNAFSCDIQECSGGHPEWHFHQDCLHVMQSGGGMKEDGVEYYIDGKWDLIIAHPPCTYLTVSGNRWFDVERYGEKAIQRAKDREEGAEFFMKFAKFDDCDHIAIENPIGIMSTRWRKADQIIQPYQFGHPYTKQTCLWLKNLPKLNPTDVLQNQSLDG